MEIFLYINETKGLSRLSIAGPPHKKKKMREKLLFPGIGSVNGAWMKGLSHLIKAETYILYWFQIRCQNVVHFTHKPAAVLPEHGVKLLISRYFSCYSTAVKIDHLSAAIVCCSYFGHILISSIAGTYM